MGKKSNVRTRRNQYDEFLNRAYHKTCKDVEVLGFEFPSEERQKQFHYGLMEYCLDDYLLYDGAGCVARVICAKQFADKMRGQAENFDGKEFRVMLDEEI